MNTNDNIETANNAALLTEASTHATKTTNTEETDENADKNAKENGDDGPEGRSLYCLNLNCRAPPGRSYRLDLSFR